MKRLGDRMKRTIDLFASASTKQQKAALNFEDLFRGALQWYLRSPDRRISEFEDNSRAIKALLSNVTVQDSPLNLGSMRDLCAVNAPSPLVLPKGKEKNPLGCVSIARDINRWQVLWYALNKERRFPLAVIAAGSGSASISLDWLATEGELTIEDFPEDGQNFLEATGGL